MLCIVNYIYNFTSRDIEYAYQIQVSNHIPGPTRKEKNGFISCNQNMISIYNKKSSRQQTAPTYPRKTKKTN